MIGAILEWMAGLIIAVIEYTGYAGITILSALESANIPIPSEIVVPFAGFLSSQGTFSLVLVIGFATVGNLIGSWFSYELGRKGGRRFLERYGKWVLIGPHDLMLADRLFLRFGSSIVFFGRLLPIVRTFISFPAGISRMPRKKFLAYTLTGSLIWNGALAYIGFLLGENWHAISGYTRTFDWLIAGIIIVGLGWWIMRHLRSKNIYS